MRSSSKTRKVTGKDVLNNLLYKLVQIVTLPVRFLVWITHPPGSAILLAGLSLYFILLSAEGYWQALPGIRPAFLPKLFIDDGATLLNLPNVFSNPNFWVVFVVSLANQCIQAWILRDVAISQAKAEYEAHKNFRVDEGSDDEIQIVDHLRQRYRNAGMRKIRARGLVILLSYAIDVAIALFNFPLIGVRLTTMFCHLVWAIAQIIGAELSISQFLLALEESRLQPKVEVAE